jgi:hypothetical protein
LAVLLLAVACNGGGGGNPDATGDGSGSGGPANLTCVQIRDLLEERVEATPRSCTTTGDCGVVGAATDSFGSPTCNCAATYGYACWGNPVNTAAWLADARAQALDREWRQRCVPQGCAALVCVCDCGYDPAECRDGVCRNDIPNCFPDLVDAAPDSSPSDATTD